MIDKQTTQDGFLVMDRLAAICATSGISEEAKKAANEQIEAIITKIIKPSITELTAKTAGIIQR